MSDETKSLNLVQKLASIRRELTHIEKKGKNTFQNYDYLRAEDIAGELGDRLSAMNVIVARSNLKVTMTQIPIKDRVDMHALVELTYVFLDGDSHSEGIYDSLPVESAGEGRDSGDKAVAKALTNALKYALSQPLMMRIGDDPEADSAHDQDRTGKYPPLKGPKKGIPISAKSLSQLQAYFNIHPDEQEAALKPYATLTLVDISEPQARVLLDKIKEALNVRLAEPNGEIPLPDEEEF